MKEDIDDKKRAPRKPKTYVLDTTVLIDDPNLMYRLGNSIIAIPFVVLKEIDGLKKSDDSNTAKSAREVARTLDRISSYADLAKGVKLSTGGVLAVTAGYDDFDGLASEADNRIVGTALMLKRNGHDVELLTTDANMRTAVRLKRVKGDVPLVGSTFNFEDNGNIGNDKTHISEMHKKQGIKHPGLKFLGLILATILVTGILNFLVKALKPLILNFSSNLLPKLGFTDISSLFIYLSFCLFFGLFLFLLIYLFSFLPFSTNKRNRWGRESNSASYGTLEDPLINDPIFHELPGNIWHYTLDNYNRNKES